MNHPVDSKEFWLVSFTLIVILTLCLGGIYSMSLVQKRVEANLKTSIDMRHQQVIESFIRTDKSLQEVKRQLEVLQSQDDSGDLASASCCPATKGDL